MSHTLDKNDYRTLLTLLARVQITGQEATTVAILQQKLNGLFTALPVEKPKEKDVPVKK
jgi:hypothetical protein